MSGRPNGGLRQLPRPAPAQTPLQSLALSHLGEAIRASHSDRRTFETFVSVAIDRLAAEAARLLERERRP